VTFRDQLLKKILPEYLVFAVLAIAVRFSNDPFYENQQQQFASKYAYRAWNDILHQCFEGGGGPDYRLVQAATLLALHDFTGA
jgi:hypothetical protein